MYPFLDHLLPDDFPPFLLSFINWIILLHVAALAFYFIGLAKDLIVGAPAKAP
jgi:hypothetical protein